MKNKYKKYLRYRHHKNNTIYIIRKLLQVIVICFVFIYAMATSLLKAFKLIKRYIINSKYLREIGISYDQVEQIIKTMTGREFEIFCAGLFKALGYRVKLTPQSCDGGKDIILYSNNEITYVEAKRWSEESGYLVGREVLQKLIGSAIADGVDKAICITTGKYNNNAREYAKKIDNLELYNMDDIMQMVVEITPRQLHRILLKTLNTDIKIIRLNPILKKC